jgi:hypothetical protein
MPAISILLDIQSEVKDLFDYAGDLTKQLLTLSAGIITISVTFAKDIAKNNPRKIRRYISLCWIFNFLSIFFGILSLMALTGAIDDAISTGEKVTMHGNMRVFTALQIITFLLGLVNIIIYGNMGIMHHQSSAKTEKPK